MVSAPESAAVVISSVKSEKGICTQELIFPKKYHIFIRDH